MNWRDKPKYRTDAEAFLVGDHSFNSINKALRACYKITETLGYRRAWVTLNILNGPAIMEIGHPRYNCTIPRFNKAFGLTCNRRIFIRAEWGRFD